VIFFKFKYCFKIIFWQFFNILWFFFSYQKLKFHKIYPSYNPLAIFSPFQLSFIIFSPLKTVRN
jgi:hypothetical protein